MDLITLFDNNVFPFNTFIDTISYHFIIIIYFYIQQSISTDRLLFKTIFKKYPNSINKEREESHIPTIYELTNKL